MPVTTFFNSRCPRCGCGLLVPIQSLGAKFSCQHCGSQFRAREVSSSGEQFESRGPIWMPRCGAVLLHNGSKRYVNLHSALPFAWG